MESCVWGLLYVAFLESLCSEKLLASWSLRIHLFYLYYSFCPINVCAGDGPWHTEVLSTSTVNAAVWCEWTNCLTSHLNASCSAVALRVIPAVTPFCHLSNVFLKEACLSECPSVPFPHLQLETKKVQANSTRLAWRQEVWCRAQNREGRWRTATTVWREMWLFSQDLAAADADRSKLQ